MTMMMMVQHSIVCNPDVQSINTKSTPTGLHSTRINHAKQEMLHPAAFLVPSALSWTSMCLRCATTYTKHRDDDKLEFEGM